MVCDLKFEFRETIYLKWQDNTGNGRGLYLFNMLQNSCFCQM